MPADLGTKPLPGPRIELLKDFMGMWISNLEQVAATDGSENVPELLQEVKIENFKQQEQ